MNPAVLAGETSIIVTFLASFLIWIMFGGLLVLWVIDGKTKKEQVLHAISSCLLAFVVSEMLKSLFPTVRPFWLNGNMVQTLTIPKDPSFPSMHTAVALALGVSVWLHQKTYGALFLLGAIVVGLARIVGNVHYFIDILGGAGIGILSSYTLARLHFFGLIKSKK